MKFRFLRPKPRVTERLLDIRHQAGEDILKHARYHKMLNRYQRILLRTYLLKKRFPFLKWFLK